MVPKFMDPGEMLSCPGLVPLPDSDMVRLPSEASDMNVSFPLALPAIVGAKTIVRVMLWPGARVSEALKPLRLNPAPVRVACETVTLEPPEFVRATYCV
jgi:hypothetical protein